MDGWFFRLVCFLVGVDPEILKRCPLRDRGNILTIGGLLIGVWIWQLIVISVALHAGLARPGEFRPEFIGLAGLVATLVLLFDSYLVRASWEATGQEQLNRAGMRLPVPWSAKLKDTAFMAVRVSVTVLLALLTGSLMSLMLFSKDVEGQIAATVAQRNNALVQVIGQRVDGETRRLEGEREQQLAAVAKADGDASNLRQSVLSQLPIDPEAGLVTDRIRDLTRRRDGAERRVAQLGQGSRDAIGAARLSAARRNLENLNRDLGAAQDRLSALQTRRDGAVQRLTGTIDGRLKETSDARDVAEVRVRQLDVAIAQRAETREATIRSALVRDAGYVPPDDGLLAKLRILKGLTADPFIFWTVVLLDAVFVAIELAAVLSKVMTFIPAAYALKLAVETVKNGHVAREELAKVLGLDPSTPQSSPTDPRGEPSSEGSHASDFVPPPVSRQERPNVEQAGAPPDDEAAAGLDDRLIAGARAARDRQRAQDAKSNSAAVREPSHHRSTSETTPEAPDAVNRGPGRPPGSKNKPKANGAEPAGAAEE